MQIKLDMQSKESLYMQIYYDIKYRINHNIIATNSKLPSSRSLAMQLNVSRNTVELAYSQLLSEGYIYAKARSGYYITNIAELPTISMNSKVSPIIPSILSNDYIDFSPFHIDTKLFPYHTWKKLYKVVMNQHQDQLFMLGNNQGDLPLRHAIHNYVTNFRFVNCKTEHIIIGAGSDYLLQLLCQLMKVISKTSNYSNFYNHIGMENPTYMRAYHIFHGYDYKISPITMDNQGICVKDLDKEGCNLVYITPSHQYPTGNVMSITRRIDLLQWANQSKCRYIIEDDHDSEFRYKGKPIPSLQGIDTEEKVIYLGTFSRALTPALRVAYMILPDELYHLYQEHLFYYSSTVSRIDQSILTEFINGGFFERHLNKMRKNYKSKHDTLLNALKIFNNNISISGEQAGLHLLVTFYINLTEEELITIAKESDIKLYGISNHYIQKPIMTNPTILLGFANLTLDEINTAIHSLYNLLLPFMSKPQLEV